MALTNYGFILKAPEYDYTSDRTELTSPVFTTRIIAVSNDVEAEQAARELIEQGVQVLEFCGGFDKATVNSLRKALGTDIPMGVVQFDETDLEKLGAL